MERIDDGRIRRFLLLNYGRVWRTIPSWRESGSGCGLWMTYKIEVNLGKKIELADWQVNLPIVLRWIAEIPVTACYRITETRAKMLVDRAEWLRKDRLPRGERLSRIEVTARPRRIRNRSFCSLTGW